MMPPQSAAWPSAEMTEQPVAVPDMPPAQEFPAAQEWPAEPPPPSAEAFTEAVAPPVEPPPAAVMVLPSDESSEVQAVLDPEPVTMAGLGNAPATIVGIDWRALSVFAGFTLGTWWLLRNRRPSPRSRRR
jgi:hypothetical protein